MSTRVPSTLAFTRSKAVPCTVGCCNSMSAISTFETELARELLVRHRSWSGCWPSTMDGMTLDRWVPLSIGEIHVWTARLDDPHTTADLLRILGQEERARAAQLAFERDRVRFIKAHGMARQILAGYSDADAATLTFARNRHGKPYLVPRANGPDLQFSVSHSGNCCMLAVRLDHSIGIDVEKV